MITSAPHTLVLHVSILTGVVGGAGLFATVAVAAVAVKQAFSKRSNVPVRCVVEYLIYVVAVNACMQ